MRTSACVAGACGSDHVVAKVRRVCCFIFIFFTTQRVQYYIGERNNHSEQFVNLRSFRASASTVFLVGNKRQASQMSSSNETRKNPSIIPPAMMRGSALAVPPVF